MINLEEVIIKYINLKFANEELIKNFSDFDDEIRNFAEDSGIEINDSEVEEGIENGSIAVDESFGFAMSESLKEAMKKEYRAISKICHPDVQSSNILGKFFLRASSAYEEDNIFEIIEVSSVILDKKEFDICAADRDSMLEYLNKETIRVKSHRLWKWKTMSHKDKTREFVKTLGAISR